MAAKWARYRVSGRLDGRVGRRTAGRTGWWVVGPKDGKTCEHACRSGWRASGQPDWRTAGLTDRRAGKRPDLVTDERPD